MNLRNARLYVRSTDGEYDMYLRLFNKYFRNSMKFNLNLISYIFSQRHQHGDLGQERLAVKTNLAMVFGFPLAFVTAVFQGN